MLYAIKDCANLSIFDKATNNPFLFADYANVATNEWTSERVFATAKGTNAIGWDSNKQSTLTVETEVFDLKWLAMLAGTEIKKGAKEIAKREVVRVLDGGIATISGSAVEGSLQVIQVSGNDEVEHVGQALTLVKDATEALTADQFTVTGGTITFGANVEVGTPFAVYYLVEQTDVRTLTISADKFPSSYRVLADALIREKETGADEFVQIEYFNAKPQGNFTITMSATEPTTLSITFDLFPNKNKEMAEYRIIG